MKLSDVTPLQWIGIIILFNTTLIGGAGQLGDLSLDPHTVKAILAVATLGNGFLGGLAMMLGGQGSMIRTVAAMPGVEKIAVNSQANHTLAQIAVSTTPDSAKVEATPAAQAAVVQAARGAAIIVAVVLSGCLVAPSDARAQGKIKTPQQIGQDIKGVFDQQKAAVTGAPTSDPKAALPCMDISVITKITPENLIPTMKGCAQDVNTRLVTDTQRALDSAKAFTGNATSVGGTAVGDNDAVNCLTPSLALFKAATIIPSVPDIAAVLNADGSVKTPSVAGTPEIDPGPILLYQKYREFTLAGGLTSCQAWFNGPINATAAAGVGGVATAVSGAAILSPIK